MCIQVTVPLQAVQTLRQPESQLISQSAGPSGNRTCGDQIVTIPVSYTHLTLPTSDGV